MKSRKQKNKAHFQTWWVAIEYIGCDYFPKLWHPTCLVQSGTVVQVAQGDRAPIARKLIFGGEHPGLPKLYPLTGKEWQACLAFLEKGISFMSTLLLIVLGSFMNILPQRLQLEKRKYL